MAVNSTQKRCIKWANHAYKCILQFQIIKTLANCENEKHVRLLYYFSSLKSVAASLVFLSVWFIHFPFSHTPYRNCISTITKHKLYYDFGYISNTTLINACYWTCYSVYAKCTWFVFWIRVSHRLNATPFHNIVYLCI